MCNMDAIAGQYAGNGAVQAEEQERLCGSNRVHFAMVGRGGAAWLDEQYGAMLVKSPWVEHATPYLLRQASAECSSLGTIPVCAGV